MQTGVGRFFPKGNQEFKFHRGSMQTSISPSSATSTSTFKFHRGSMQTFCLFYNVSKQMRSNSTVVRCKLTAYFAHKCPETLFKFHRGSMQTSVQLLFHNCIVRSNSTVVRCKQSLIKTYLQKEISSNSTVVRCKPFQALWEQLKIGVQIPPWFDANQQVPFQIACCNCRSNSTVVRCKQYCAAKSFA